MHDNIRFRINTRKWIFTGARYMYSTQISLSTIIQISLKCWLEAKHHKINHYYYYSRTESSRWNNKPDYPYEAVHCNNLLYLLIDHEKSNGMDKLPSVFVLFSWDISCPFDGGLMVQREVDCPGNTTRRKSSC